MHRLTVTRSLRVARQLASPRISSPPSTAVRPLCAQTNVPSPSTPAPPPKQPTSARPTITSVTPPPPHSPATSSSAEPAVHPSVPSAAEPFVQPAPAESANASPANTTPAASAVPAAPAAGEVAAKIPDVPSTSLGFFEEADAKDPNKWKKFAWKYLGSLVTFLIAYKTLHWYVDRLEADGKRRREELEEQKAMSKEERETQLPQPAFSLAAQQPRPQRAGDAALQMHNLAPASTGVHGRVDGENEASGDAGAPRTPQEYADRIISQLPQSSSELDELRAYRRDLEANLAQLAAESTEAADMKEELASLAEEIAHFESKSR